MGGAIAFPEHGVRPSRERRNRRVRAQTRGADDLAAVVDPEGESDGVAGERTEFLNRAVRRPFDGFKLENLTERRAAGQASPGRCAILRKPDYLASIVETKSVGVALVAAQERGQRAQGPISPDGPQALTLGAPSAKVLSVRIWIGSLGANRRLAAGVGPVRPTVAAGAGGSLQCAEVSQRTVAKPKEGVLGASGSQV